MDSFTQTYPMPRFADPPDTVLDIPVPPSVNKTRRVNWAARKDVEAWQIHADKTLMANGQYRKAKKHPIADRFELTVILNEKTCGQDADNPLKGIIDYLRRIKLIRDDSKKYLRKITVEWGTAPTGCRLILKAVA